MAKHPADRYQSAWEMAGDLERLRNGQITAAARMHVNEEEDEQPTEMVGAAAPAAAAHRAPIQSTRPTEDDDNQGGGWMKWLAAFLAALLVAIVGYFAWDFFSSEKESEDKPRQTQSAHEDKITVPEVENRPRNEVVKELEDMGLQVTVNEEANPDIPRNNAIRINPAPGSELQKNASVTLTVSSGKEITDVPDITGMTLDEASHALEEAGLALNSDVSEQNDEAPAGQVIKQDPAGGTQLSKGSKVRVTVSKGVEKKRVPNVAGMDVEDAQSRLESNDFDVDVREVDSLEPKGTVLSVSNEGAELEKGKPVTVEVSNGMLFKAPDLVRQSQKQAEDELRAAGWTGQLVPGEPVPTGALVDNNKIGWAAVNPGDTMRKDQNIDIRLWNFDPAALLPQP